MKRFRRLLSLVMLLCIVATLLPVFPVAQAAETTYRYELDTDGIDPGATYLIVNTGTAGSGNALKFYYQNRNQRDFRNQTLTVKKENGVTYIDSGFTSEADCEFVFSAEASGKITHGDYAVELSGSYYVTGNPSNTLTFASMGNGGYQIYYSSYFSKYYLRYSNSDWARSSTASTVYLFKRTDYVASADVVFHGNGNTSGDVPARVEDLKIGSEYILPEPIGDLRKDIGDDTWLFLCWNTAADGTGDEYLPGDKIIITGDLVLYADWYLQDKHTISMVTYMDGVPTDVDKFAGYDRQFYAVLEGGDGTYIPMTKTAEGTYSARVPDNGTYNIYAITVDGEYSPVHGHKIIVYNQDGITECMHYSITYNTDGGVWAEGEAPTEDKCHNGEIVTAPANIPTREGYNFLGWLDQDGKLYAPGQLVTTSADRPVVLTASWEDLVTITVTVVIDHKAASGGVDTESTKHDAVLYLLREENGVNLPVEERVLNSGYVYDAATNTTTYTVVFANMPQGVYHASSIQSGYEDTVSRTGNANEDQFIRVDSKYTPEERDLTFNVVVNMDNDAEKALKPMAVNVKVTFWGLKDGVMGWHTISKQEGNAMPSTVMVDENGFGTASFTTYPKRAANDVPYEFRVEVTSIIMADGTIVPVSGDNVTYRPDSSGLYEATVAVEGGRVPTYPAGSNTTLNGAYFDGQQQMGIPTVTVEITPMTVTFNAGDGLVNGQKTLVLENQYRYPALYEYVAVSTDASKVFIGWEDENGNLVTDLTGQLLLGNVTYTARYKENITLSGTISADATYLLDGQVVEIYDVDRVKKVIVVLQKRVGDAYNDIDSTTVMLTYEKDEEGNYTAGLGEYTFADLPNDGSEYRIQAVALNYSETYDNNQDDQYSAEESLVLADATTTQTQVDIHMTVAMEGYSQEVVVDASQIQQALRPTGVRAQILYRDLGDIHAYQVISQHSVAPYGISLDLRNDSAIKSGYYTVWNRHTNGTPYEYQVQISMLYGNNVEGAYTLTGTPYTADSPFTIVYGQANNYLKETAQGGVALEATLVPKEYHIHLDMNTDDDPEATVLGMDDFLIDDDDGHAHYAYVHTWSYADSFTAYPYREGYVFTGWESPNTDEVFIQDGTIHVGSTLNQHITLKATWEPLSGTDYTIRYLEANTDRVLLGDTVISGSAQGSEIKAVEAADNVKIPGYAYEGAAIGGKYYDKSENPALTVTTDPAKNLMVIYFIPDGSDGYTDQVESNLEINKYAVLEDDGTYTITMDTYTKDNPITTLIQQNTPMDIVLVLDQSGSIYSSGNLDDLQSSVDNFVSLVAQHGSTNEVDHRIAIVGYASDEWGGYTRQNYPTAGMDTGGKWVNTGVFDSHGTFHTYSVTGFNYTEFTGLVDKDGVYYTLAHDEYLLLTYHAEYYHFLSEDEARQEDLQGVVVYGSVNGNYVTLTRNSSGLWLYGDKQLYSGKEFFTYHTNVWTHREGLAPREIHAYGLGADYKEVGEHSGVYTRTETRDANPEVSIYKDALVPVTLGAYGSGRVTPGLQLATQNLGGNGKTYVSYGMEMANSIFKTYQETEGDLGRLRIVVVFTDGKPGDNSTFDDDDANKAITYSSNLSQTYGAKVFTVGLYGTDVPDPESEQDFFMNGLSSNYPKAQSLNDVWTSIDYYEVTDESYLNNRGPYFVQAANGTYYRLYHHIKVVRENNRSVNYNCWGYDDENGNHVEISVTLVDTTATRGHPQIIDKKVNGHIIYRRYGVGYKTAENSGYYTAVYSASELNQYFNNVLREITTKVTTKVELESDTILRDIMNQGLVLTDGTVITAYTQKGFYDHDTQEIVWEVDDNGKAVLTEMVTLELDGQQTQAQKNGITIGVYNLDSQNPTNPDKDGYHPHTVDITGYDFSGWYISPEHDEGRKLIVTITRVEATDEVEWGRSTRTNNEQSGVWLPIDENGNRQLLLPFDQPTTIFVERAYVLDYGKEFVLSDWYFDDDEDRGLDANPVHVDCDISNGMNYFDPSAPNTTNRLNGEYGNTKYGNVRVEDGKVYYSPTTMNWRGYDQFYVFGDTWRVTVVNQDANENGNLWNKVTVIPANNIYFEDSFITTESTTQNGITGFTFTGEWSIVGQDSGNTEVPEHVEDATYGDVHGWTDDLSDDDTYTDGSAHATGMNGEMGAKAEFTFTGTGVEVYTTTNAKSGMVVAILTRHITTDDGREITELRKSIALDNLAMSGGEDTCYYHIPTVSFKDLPYGTYSLMLIATATDDKATGEKRYEYIIDGVRIHNPLGNNTTYQSGIVQDAYGLEVNAVYTEVRDILLDNGDFNLEMEDGTDGKMGAVFIDWIRKGQGSGEDQPGVGVPSYEVGSFELYGPKNEVYLAGGQAIVLKVQEGNYYYVGMKSLTGEEVTVHVSGITQANPTEIKIGHTTDMYYQVTPVNGYIVIQNANTDGALLSLTNLRTTNLTAPAPNGGVVDVTPQEAVEVVGMFAAYMQEKANAAEDDTQPSDPEETVPSVEEQAQSNLLLANALFTSVRQWLDQE